MNKRQANKLLKRNASCGHLDPITGRWTWHYRKTTRRRMLDRPTAPLLARDRAERNLHPAPT